MKTINHTKRVQKCLKMNDNDLIEALTSIPVNEEICRYFFYVKCKRLLTYISTKLYHDSNYTILIGELYSFLSKNNWHVLRCWTKKNDCSLDTYLTKCAFNHFANIIKQENNRNEHEISYTDFDSIQDNYIQEENDCFDTQSIIKAYESLNERDKILLKTLVIEENSLISVAPIIWHYFKSKNNYNQLPVKRVQSTISMAKKRAISNLSNKYNCLVNNRLTN